MTKKIQTTKEEICKYAGDVAQNEDWRDVI